jgi:HNH endonuclease
MDLRYLTGNELEESTVVAVRSEKRATAVVIAHVKEVNNQRHYSALGYRSPYDYLTRKHNYCAGSADRLIKTASLIAEVPRAQVMFTDGEISLTNLAMSQKFFQTQEIRDLTLKEKIVSQLKHKSKDEAEKFLFSLIPDEKKPKAPPDTRRRIDENLVQLTITVKDSVVDSVQRYKSLSGKSLTDGEVFELAMDLLLEKEEGRKFKRLKRPKREGSPPVEKVEEAQKGPRKRKAIPLPLQRALYERAGNKCERCGSVHKLQINHRFPWSIGGEDTFDNLNILCFNCNDKDRIDAKLSRKGPD